MITFTLQRNRLTIYESDRNAANNLDKEKWKISNSAVVRFYRSHQI